MHVIANGGKGHKGSMKAIVDENNGGRGLLCGGGAGLDWSLQSSGI